jgi:DHA1 family tetracycline resistance protein-like MFS transporter
MPCELPPIVGVQAAMKLPGAPFLLASALLVLALSIVARTLSIPRVAARLD